LGENCVKVTIPEGLTSGQTEVHITRGNASALLKNVNFTVSTSIYPAKNPEVVAHRGYHPGNVSENSISSLVEAQKLGVFGSEFDVYVTTDNVVVIYHDATLGNGLRIDSSTYNDLKSYKLGNGESLPTFEQHLIQGKKYPDVKLVCEVKPHATLDLSLKCVDACAALVNQYDMADQVAWISFDYNVCKKIAELYPDAKVQYLSDSNPPLDPETVLNDGINGIDYQMKVLSDALIYKAHELGMDVNVWTVNNRSDMFKFIEKGVDYITTNESAVALELVSRPYITE
jgi:glycerophosphoryl diester phosphodiesterase